MKDENKPIEHIELSTVRHEKQRKVMEQIKEDGVCPFCMENLSKYHKNPILIEGDYWLITDNQWPYEKVKHQVLAIHKEHIEHIKDLKPKAGAELFKLFGQVAKERNIPGGGVAIRFGSNPEHGNYGSSVKHLHAHLIEPDLEALKETEAFRFKFGQPKNYKKK